MGELWSPTVGAHLPRVFTAPGWEVELLRSLAKSKARTTQEAKLEANNACDACDACDKWWCQPSPKSM